MTYKPSHPPAVRIAMTKRAWAFGARAVRAVRLIAKDGRIPRPLRWLLLLSLLPVPGPFDEALLLLIAPLLAISYRQAIERSVARSRAG